jgi:hypothetical protein
MTSYFSIIRYVPDPLTGEQMNIGVVVFGDGKTRVRFTRDWQRLQSFGGDNAQFLRHFAESARRSSSENLPLPGFEEPIDLSEDSVRAVAGKWMNSIQFSEVKASRLEPDDLLEDIGPRVLRVRRAARHPYRTRRAAVSLAYKEVEDGLRAAVGKDWPRFYRKKPELEGRLQNHAFDVGIENGQPLLAARGLSFEGPASPDLEKEIRVTAWALDDIRESGAKTQLAVVALPPQRSTKLFDEAARVFRELNAQVVLEDEAHDWAASAARDLALS